MSEPVNLKSRWTPTQTPIPAGPWPRMAINQDVADQAVRWMYEATYDMHCDVGLACLLKEWIKTPHPSDLLRWFEFSPHALPLLEKIRTSGNEPVPLAAFRNLPEISKDEYEELQGIHGVYLHYLVVRLPNGKIEKRVYIGKGAAKITAIDDGPGIQTNAKQIGIVSRWENGHFRTLHNQKAANEDEGATSLHGELMLKPRPHETILERKIVALFGTTALDAITVVHGRDRDAANIVKRLFRHRTGNKKAQDYGMDDITEEKVAAWIRFGENMALLLAGAVLKDSPRTFQVGTKSGAPWTSSNFSRSRDLYAAMMRDLSPPGARPFKTANVQSPIVEKARHRLMPVETFLARVEDLAQFRPSDYERSWMERKRHYATLAESVLPKEYGYSIDYRTSPSKVQEWWKQMADTQGFVQLKLDGTKCLPFINMTGEMTYICQAADRLRSTLHMPFGKDGSRFVHHLGFPDEIKIPVAQDADAKTAFVYVQITKLDSYGCLHKDLTGVFIWIADERRNIVKVLGRLNHPEEIGGGEIAMAQDDVVLFLNIGSVLHVASVFMRIKGLHQTPGFLYEDALFELDYNLALYHLSKNAPAAQSHLFRPEKIGYKTMLADMRMNTDQVKQSIRLLSNLYAELPQSANVGQQFDEEVAVRQRDEIAFLDKLAAIQLVDDRTPSAFQSICHGQESLVLHIQRKVRQTAPATIGEELAEALEDSLLSACLLRAGSGRVFESHIWQWRSGIRFVGLPAIHTIPFEPNQHNRFHGPVHTYDKHHLSFLDEHYGTSRFCVLLAKRDGQFTLVRFMLRQVGIRDPSLELSHLSSEATDHLVGLAVEAISAFDFGGEAPAPAQTIKAALHGTAGPLIISLKLVLYPARDAYQGELVRRYHPSTSEPLEVLQWIVDVQYFGRPLPASELVSCRPLLVSSDSGAAFVEAVNQIVKSETSYISEFIAHFFRESSNVPCYPEPVEMIQFLYEPGVVVAGIHEESPLALMVQRLTRATHAIIVKLAYRSGCLPPSVHHQLSSVIKGEDLRPAWSDLSDAETDEPSLGTFRMPPSQVRIKSTKQDREEAEQLTLLLWHLSGLLEISLTGQVESLDENAGSDLYRLYMQVLRSLCYFPTSDAISIRDVLKRLERQRQFLEESEQQYLSILFGKLVTDEDLDVAFDALPHLALDALKLVLCSLLWDAEGAFRRPMAFGERIALCFFSWREQRSEGTMPDFAVSRAQGKHRHVVGKVRGTRTGEHSTYVVCDRDKLLELSIDTRGEITSVEICSARESVHLQVLDKTEGPVLLAFWQDANRQGAKAKKRWPIAADLDTVRVALLRSSFATFQYVHTAAMEL
ncbi:hypothetical protein NliqN6_6241 [Naganishia liquefaciens]|uniref:Uncharacterized protein n=1 Tax=Naganishia liquefaciens TaxID=104408 RepID=A0A8H3U118_9TREE|nr:hypothetical protein NliqN6_6241 [Naganishia liquefaciens]